MKDKRISGIRARPRALGAVAALTFAFAFASVAHAAWYWPFDPDDEKKPPRLHRLLEKANDYIDQAEDESLNGNGDKAIENYRLALSELDRVERENPERAETPEFAPLRTKRATCQSAIDAIRFAQVNENTRAVSVTDTRELQKKWNRKHGVVTPEEAAEERRKKAEAEKTAVKADAPDPELQAGCAAVLADLKKKAYPAASQKLDALEKGRPDELNLLLLRAALQVCQGQDFAARRTLERAVRVHGKSYLPLYNLANLSLKIDDDVDAARRHYEKGRSLGGPRNEALEKRIERK
jgi:hypothetical protein